MSKRVQAARKVEAGCYLLATWVRKFGLNRLNTALKNYLQREQDKVYSANGEEALAHSIYLDAKAKAKAARENFKRIEKEVKGELWLD